MADKESDEASKQIIYALLQQQNNSNILTINQEPILAHDSNGIDVAFIFST